MKLSVDQSEGAVIFVDAGHDKRHTPEKDEHWQECWLLTYFDPKTKIGGYQHIGMQPNRSIGDSWSWHSINGELVHNFQSLRLPYTDEEFTDMSAGVVRLRSLKPNVQRAVDIVDGNVLVSLTYEAFTDRAFIARSAGKKYLSDVAKGHYESLGTVTGTITVDGKETRFNGFGFDDRSWGKRDWSDIVSYRFVYACFGKDLYLALYNMLNPTGGSQWGYVFDRGTFHDVVAVEFKVTMNDDGVTTHGAKIVAWTQSNGGYVLSCETNARNVITHRDGFMTSPALCQFEMGGRLGAGLLEVCELKKPTPYLRQKYSLSEDV